MIKVYDMTSGVLVSQGQNDNYDDEVLYSEHQPIVKDFVDIRLQEVEVTSEKQTDKGLEADLADIDCESFISSQSTK